MYIIEALKYIKYESFYKFNKNNFFFNNIVTNSKNVKKNSIFAIKNNVKFKNKYIEEAIKNGAILILTNKYTKTIDIPQLIVKNIEVSIFKILNILKPNKPKNTIAITGTNGKTTVLWYVSQICFNNKIPIKTYGTLGFYTNNTKKNKSILTTPEAEILYQTAFTKKKKFI